MPIALATDGVQFRHNKVLANDLFKTVAKTVAHLLVCFGSGRNLVDMRERLDFNEKYRTFPFSNDVYRCKVDRTRRYWSLLLRRHLIMLSVVNEIRKEGVVWPIVFRFVCNKTIKQSQTALGSYQSKAQLQSTPS